MAANVCFQVTYSPPDFQYGQSVCHTVHLQLESGRQAVKLERISLDRWEANIEVETNDMGGTRYRYYVEEHTGIEDSQGQRIAQSPLIELEPQQQDEKLQVNYTLSQHTDLDCGTEKAEYLNPLLPVAARMQSLRQIGKKGKARDHGLDAEQQRRMLGDFTGLQPEQQFALLLGLLQNYFDHLRGEDKRALRDQFNTLQQQQQQESQNLRASRRSLSVPRKEAKDPFKLVRKDCEDKEWNDFLEWKEDKAKAASDISVPVTELVAEADRELSEQVTKLQAELADERTKLAAQEAANAAGGELLEQVTKLQAELADERTKLAGQEAANAEAAAQMQKLQGELQELSALHAAAKAEGEKGAAREAERVSEQVRAEREGRERAEAQLEQMQAGRGRQRAVELSALSMVLAHMLPAPALPAPAQEEQMLELRSTHLVRCEEVLACADQEAGGEEPSISGENCAGAARAAVAAASKLVSRFNEENKRRKVLQEQVHELKGGIRVLARVRPMGRAGGETDAGGAASVWAAGDGDIEVSATEGGSGSGGSESKRSGGKAAKSFKYDRVFAPDSTQQQVYAEVAPMVQSVVDGYNACVMAYGQTGSGKTHTMLGPDLGSDDKGDDGGMVMVGEHAGVMVRAVSELVGLVRAREGVTHEQRVEVGVVEVYNEKIRDLLHRHANAPAGAGADAGEGKGRGSLEPLPELDVRRGKAGNVEIRGMTQLPIETAGDVMALLRAAMGVRAVKATAMNAESSRSHLMLFVRLSAVSLSSGKGAVSTLTMVDLAGSERVARSGVQGQSMKEAVGINKSLAALGDVMHSLQSKSPHVPYRNSVLTHALMDMLGGKAKVAMILQLSPATGSREETVCSLEFGARVGKIALGAAKRNVVQTSALGGTSKERGEAERQRRELEQELGALQKKLKKALASQGKQGLQAQGAAAELSEVKERARAAEERARQLEKQLQQAQVQAQALQRRDGRSLSHQQSTSAGSNRSISSDDDAGAKRRDAVKARREKAMAIQQERKQAEMESKRRVGKFDSGASRTRRAATGTAVARSKVRSKTVLSVSKLRSAKKASSPTGAAP